MKEGICAAFGMIGGVIASFFGGWNAALTTLVIFMATDYITGLVLAAVFHKSTKTENGALESKAGWKGLVRKCATLLLVMIASRLDMMIGTTMIKDTVVIGFCCNECISILENAGQMGIPIPAAITNAIDVLTKKNNESEETKE